MRIDEMVEGEITSRQNGHLNGHLLNSSNNNTANATLLNNNNNNNNINNNKIKDCEQDENHLILEDNKKMEEEILKGTKSLVVNGNNGRPETEHCAIPDVLKYELDRIIGEAEEKVDWSKNSEEEASSSSSEENSEENSSDENSDEVEEEVVEFLEVIEECDEEEYEELEEDDENEDDEDSSSEFASDSDATITNESVQTKQRAVQFQLQIDPVDHIEPEPEIQETAEVAVKEPQEIIKEDFLCECVNSSEENTRVSPTEIEWSSSNSSTDTATAISSHVVEIDEGKIVRNNGHAPGETGISTEDYPDYPDGENCSRESTSVSPETPDESHQNNSVKTLSLAQSDPLLPSVSSPPPPLLLLESGTGSSGQTTTVSTISPTNVNTLTTNTNTNTEEIIPEVTDTNTTLSSSHYSEITNKSTSLPVGFVEFEKESPNSKKPKKSVKFSEQLVQSYNFNSSSSSLNLNNSLAGSSSFSNNTNYNNNTNKSLVNEEKEESLSKKSTSTSLQNLEENLSQNHDGKVILRGRIPKNNSNSIKQVALAASIVPVVINDTNSLQSPSSEYFVLKYLAQEQQRQLDLVDLTKLWGQHQQNTYKNHQSHHQHSGQVLGVSGSGGILKGSAAELISFDSGKELSQFIEANTAGSYFSDNNFSNGEMHQRLSSSCSEHQHQPLTNHHLHKPRSVLKKGGIKKSRGDRSVTFNESLNLFYEAECSCWIHEDDYARLRQEEQAQQQLIYEQATNLHHLHHHHHHQQNHQGISHHSNFIYEPPPLEFEDTPTLSPPEGYKDRFFPQTIQIQQQSVDSNSLDPDVTRVSPPSPPAARRKVFLKENSTDQQQLMLQQQQQQHNHHHHHHHRPILNGLDEEEDDENRKKGSRFGGILKGGRLWRSNSSESKKVTSPSEEPDVVKCTEKDRDRISDKDNGNSPNLQNSSGGNSSQNQVQIQEPSQLQLQQQQQQQQVIYGPTKVSTGTATLRTSEQIRLAVDSTLRISRATKKNKQECSSLVEKLRWLTSLDDEDSSDSQSGFATWPSRDKNGVLANNTSLSTSNSTSSRKSDAGTSTNEEFVQSAVRHPPSIASSNEAKIKQISYTLEDIDEGLKGGENELETFITEDGGRIDRIRKRYGEDIGGDDYGFSRRPSVKGIKPKFSSTNQIFAQFTAMRQSGAETPIPQMESQYENTRLIQQQQHQQQQGPNQSQYEPIVSSNNSNQMEVGGARVNLNYDQYQSIPPAPGPPTGSVPPGGNVVVGNGNNGGRPPTEESRSSHFEMIRQSFEQASYVNYNRPHSWSVSTLPHPHAHVHSNSISGGSPAPGSGPGGGGGPGPGHIPLPGMTNNLSGSSLNIGQQQGQQGQPQQPQNNLSINHNNTPPSSMNSRPNSMPMITPQQQQQQQLQQQQQSIYGTLPYQTVGVGDGTMTRNGAVGAVGPGQPIYGTVRRVPNVIGRPLFLHYGALSVEAHPNKLVQPYPPAKVPETPSPTQQPPPINQIKYYGPPIRYYNPPPPVPPRSATTTIGSGPPGGMGDCVLERGNPEGAPSITDEEPSIKEPYSMNV